MDTTDLEIIELLTRDAQIPFSVIANRLCIGTDTVIRRYRKLKQDGIIQSASIIIDLEKCGYKGHAFISISVLTGNDISRLYHELSEVPNVLTVAHTIGDYDFILHCVFSDLSSLVRLNQNIAKVRGIKSILIACLPMQGFMTAFPIVDYYSKAISDAKQTPNGWFGIQTKGKAQE